MDLFIFPTKFYDLLTYRLWVIDKKLSIYKNKNGQKISIVLTIAMCYKIEYEFKCVFELFFYLVLVCNPILGSTLYLFFIFMWSG